MSKAKERSKEIMQAALDYANTGCGVPIMDEFTRTLCIILGQAFMAGAKWADEHQAEKDLELRWEDIKTIDRLLRQCVDYINYQEVLERFKERKGE